jgi:hypothetical protein
VRAARAAREGGGARAARAVHAGGRERPSCPPLPRLQSPRALQHGQNTPAARARGREGGARLRGRRWRRERAAARELRGRYTRVDRERPSCSPLPRLQSPSVHCSMGRTHLRHAHAGVRAARGCEGGEGGARGRRRGSCEGGTRAQRCGGGGPAVQAKCDEDFTEEAYRAHSHGCSHHSFCDRFRLLCCSRHPRSHRHASPHTYNIKFRGGRARGGHGRTRTGTDGHKRHDRHKRHTRPTSKPNQLFTPLKCCEWQLCPVARRLIRRTLRATLAGWATSVTQPVVATHTQRRCRDAGQYFSVALGDSVRMLRSTRTNLYPL